jgi:hypothetical protein
MIKREVLLCLGVLVLSLLVVPISAEKIDIEVDNNYAPGEEVNFKIVLYNDDNEKIDGKLNYNVRNYYTEIIEEGVIDSGKSRTLELPENAIRGLWKINADYNVIKKDVWFNVGELEKAEISLEGNKLIITNVGNVQYKKGISISIGDHSETALVGLEIGRTKEILLTAPEGEYDIFVSDGTEENTLEFNGVSLTGNVVGLEKMKGNGFWNKYPMVSLFLGALVLVVIIVAGLKIKKEYGK